MVFGSPICPFLFSLADVAFCCHVWLRAKRVNLSPESSHGVSHCQDCSQSARYRYFSCKGTEKNPEGVEITGISPGYPPHLRRYDFLGMNNPFMGYSERTVITVGLKLATEGETKFIRHTWNFFENGMDPLDGRYGCPILDQRDSIVGLFGLRSQGKRDAWQFLRRSCGSSGTRYAMENNDFNF